MNVQVKHNGTYITDYVISYDRQHKICTGIGEINLVVDRTVGRAFDPWDTIDIYENGSFKVRYFISDVTNSDPDATITIDAQDESKRLVDYFIPESITVDYPSNTRYWIEYFLDMANVTYQFTTTDNGPLLSNFTQLGLVSAYEQLMVLLQQSGWYMYFDGNSKAIIGKLETDVSDLKANLGKTDILDIQKKSHDKMLRNRALVMGAFDPLYNSISVADLTIHTPWNYDHNDIRTMVVSNSNIPNSSSAYGIASTLLKEFAQINIEKTLTVHGARNLTLGDSIAVTSNVFRGRGLITTFGVSMSKDGLLTHITLDERCPRLYGFFDFGDSVYVGTYGDGIWRKHIKLDPTFYDFSTGLDDLAIVDLHINDGLFTSVAASGGMYYTIHELPWKPIIIESLESSLEKDINDPAVSGVYTPVTFSGIKARATIINRVSNSILYGVDTYSGVNQGDYFTSISGYSLTQSGYTNAEGITLSGYRGWVVEYKLESGYATPTSYPIHVSGNYDVRVVDMESDGVYDYVSIAEYGGLENDGNNWNYGRQTASPYAYHSELSAIVAGPKDMTFIENNPSAYGQDTMEVGNKFLLAASDEGNIGERWVVTLGKDKYARETRFVNQFNDLSGEWEVAPSYVTSASTMSHASIDRVVGVYPTSSYRTYRFICYDRIFSGYNGYKFYYQDWDAYNDTWGSLTVFYEHGSYGGATSVSGEIISPMIVDGYFYFGWRYGIAGSYNPFVGWTSPGRLLFEVIKTEINTLSTSMLRLVNFEMPLGGSIYYHMTALTTQSWESASVPAGSVYVYQKGNDVGVMGRVHLALYQPGTGEINTKEYVISGTTSGVTITQVYDGANRVGGTFPSGNISKLTNTKAIVYGASATYFIYSDESQIYYSAAPTPGQVIEANVRPVISKSEDNYYIAYVSGSWLLVDASNPLSYTTITPPAGYSLDGMFPRTFDTYQSKIYWRCYNTSLFKYELVPYTINGGFDTSNVLSPSYIPSSTTRGTNFGGFFINEPSSYGAAIPRATVYYLNFGEPDTSAVRFLVMVKDGENFGIVEADSIPIRIDVSNYAPLLSITSGSDSFVSSYLYEGALTQVDPTVLNPEYTFPVNDFRYGLYEIGSGYTLLATTASGIWWDEVATLSGIQHYADIPSGVADKIETTNYAAGSQYIFVTTSGDNPIFYQRDPDSVVFESFDSLPASRATIIRIDDGL